MDIIRINSKGPEVEDVQRRLIKLGYDVGPSGIDGFYSDETAEAVRKFRLDSGLSDENFIDSVAWASLVDASFVLGERMLYLRMPYLHGNDVKSLQMILSTLGFSCGPVDSIFGAYTENALRDFQANMGLESDGIAGDSTFKALSRLHHVYKDTDLLPEAGADWGFSRAADVLTSTPICFYGTDEFTRQVASAISNLAFATTIASKVVSAQAMSSVPDSSMLMIELTRTEYDPSLGLPLVVLDDYKFLVPRFSAAISSLSEDSRRVVIQLDPDQLVLFEEGNETSSSIRGDEFATVQHFAVMILDGVCRSFS